LSWVPRIGDTTFAFRNDLLIASYIGAHVTNSRRQRDEDSLTAAFIRTTILCASPRSRQCKSVTFQAGSNVELFSMFAIWMNLDFCGPSFEQVKRECDHYTTLSEVSLHARLAMRPTLVGWSPILEKTSHVTLDLLVCAKCSIGNAAIQQMEHKKREEVPSSLLRRIPHSIPTSFTCTWP